MRLRGAARHGGSLTLLLILSCSLPCRSAPSSRRLNQEPASAQSQGAEAPGSEASAATAAAAQQRQPNIVPLPSVLSQLPNSPAAPGLVTAADGSVAPAPEPAAVPVPQAASTGGAAAPAPEASQPTQPATGAASNGMISAPAPTPEASTASQPTPAVEPVPLYTMAAGPDAADVLPPLAPPPAAEAAAAPPPQAAAAAMTGLSPAVEPAPVSSTAAPKQPSGPSAPARQGTAWQGYWDNVQPDQISNFACGIGGVSPNFQVGRISSFLVVHHSAAAAHRCSWLATQVQLCICFTNHTAPPPPLQTRFAGIHISHAREKPCGMCLEVSYANATLCPAAGCRVRQGCGQG